MRTSNKIILATFLAPLVVLTAINLTLYAKYKSGHYVSMKTVQEDRFTRETLKNIQKIAVYGLENFNIIASDSLKLEIEKDGESHFHYTVNGDSLVIHGDSIITRPNGSHDDTRSYQTVNLYVPNGATITANNSNISLKGSKDSVGAASWNFSIVNSSSLKLEDNGAERSHVYFKDLTIHAARSSGIELTERTRIANLQLVMAESVFTDNGAAIDKLMIDADKASNLTLKGDNLQRLNAVKQP